MSVGHERVRSLLEGIPEGVLLLDPEEWRVKYANGHALALLDREWSEMVDIPLWDLYPDAEQDLRPLYEEVLEDGKARDLEFFYPPHGRWYQIRALPGEGGVVAFFRDQSEEKQAEAELRQAQKMELVGTLVSGMAHDFNNLLSVILSNTEGLKASIPGSWEEARADLEEIERSAEQGAGLVRRLLEFSRDRKVETAPMDLAEYVRSFRGTLLRWIPHRVRLRTEVDGATATVLADEEALHQVVLNLVDNAMGAMPDGGELILRAGPRSVSPSTKLDLSWTRPGRHGVLEVEDSGCGIPENARESLFEPFFTTKAPDEGTGLGLAMVARLVEQHRGAIQVRSEPGRGTTFSIFLPLAEEWADGSQDEASQDPASQVSSPGGDTDPAPVTGTILVVDDEDGIRRALERTLSRLGHRVITAENGKEGLEVVRERSDLNLAITDLSMPGMDGIALAEEIRALRPHLPLVLASGADDSGDVQAGELPDIPFLSKPWTVEELKRMVDEALS